MQELDAAKALRHDALDVSVGKGRGRRGSPRPCGRGPHRGPVLAGALDAADRAGNRVCIAIWPDGDTTPEEAAE